MKVKFYDEDGQTLAVFGDWFDTNKTQLLCFSIKDGHCGATPDYVASLKKATKYKSKQLLNCLIIDYCYTDLQVEY